MSAKLGIANLNQHIIVLWASLEKKEKSKHMADIEKIFDGLNIPKQLIEKSEALLKTLFGPSFDELAGLIADQVKLRRFNNQLKIISKAHEKLKENNIDPKHISLKILAPLIELSSLEEDETLQNKWSNLIAYILAGDKEIIFQQNCISILNKLSPDEAILLDRLHLMFLEKRKKRYDFEVEREKNRIKNNPSYRPFPLKNIESYSLNQFTFSIKSLSKELEINIPELEFYISNLISLGILKWETGVAVNATKSSDDPDDRDIDVDVSVYNSVTFCFSTIGDKFVRICKQ
jgi:hypothetical protein